MKANPGGVIDVTEIVGRDQVISQIWEILTQQSVILTAERRIGKTCITRKMEKSPPPGWFPIYQDLEGFHTAEEFARAVFDQVHQFLGRWQKVAGRAKQLLSDWKLTIADSQIEHVGRRPWKRLLTCTIEDLVEQQSPNRLVFLWDEMPYLLDNIQKREGPEAAEELLDTLRTLRQTFPAFRMLLTGSVGLHHVLVRLRDAAYANEPTNDMYSVDVTPLASPDGEELARRLIQGESLDSPDIKLGAAAVAWEADGVPFYIHHIVKCLKIAGWPADPEHVSKAVSKQLVEANDPWELAHYRNRIPAYYGKDAEAACVILDELATAAAPLSVKALLSALKAQGPQGDRAQLLRLLRLLDCDHYLSRTTDGEYQFRFPLIKRWWKLDRGL